jgi:hypothetical protein
MAIKRWNASTSQWELVGTPGTATPAAIGAAALVGNNTFSGSQTVNFSSGTNVNTGINFNFTGAGGSDFKIVRNSTANTQTVRTFRIRGGNDFDGYTSFELGMESNHPLRFVTNDTERMRIESNGSVGVGSANTATFNPDSAYNKVMVLQQTDQALTFGSYWQGGVGQSSFINSSQGSSRSAASNLFFQTGALNRFIIDTSGNVGIVNQPVDTLRYFDIYNTSSGNSAGTIIRLITNNAANTAVTTVDMVKYRNGYFGILNNDASAVIGFGTGGTERMRILSTGAVVVGHTSALNNEVLGSRATANTQNLWLDCVDPNYSTVSFGNRITRANTSAYTFLQNWSGAGSDTEHYLRGDGQAYADGSWNGGGADYAEYFEWVDGNINNEDRRGYSVSLINDKIKIAEEGDIVFGVVSGNPSVVGDDAPMKWAGKYLKDDFGSYIRDEDGYRVLNPEYDEEAEYVSRESRPEWSTIGLMGKLRLRKGQIVSPSWIKMKDISAEVEEWLVK